MRDIREGDELRAARVSLGALGAIAAVTLRCVPAFTIHRVDEPRPLDEVLPRLDELVDANDHWEAFVMPYTRRALTLTSERTDRPPEPPGRAAAFMHDVVVENAVLGLFCRTGRAFPRLIPALNRRLAGLMGRAEHLDASNRVYANTRLVRFTEMEYAIPREHAAEALERVLAMIERRRLPIGFPIELSVVAPDDALLSTAYERPDRLHRGAPVRGHGVRDLLPRRRGDHGRVRRPPALGQAPLPVRGHAAAALPGVGSFPGDPRALRPGAALRERLPEAGARMTATLYGIPGSHAVRTGELMLEHKGIPFRRVNFPPGAHRVIVRVLGFKGDRVPAVKFEDGRRAQGTRELPRVLDELVPEPRLVPDDPRALEAEVWADDVLQQWARRMVASTGADDPDALARARSRRPARRAAHAPRAAAAARRARRAGRLPRHEGADAGTTASAPARSSTGWTPGSRRAC